MTLKGHYAPCFKTRAYFGAHHESLNEGRPYNQWRRCSTMTLDSDNIRFRPMRIFEGVPWKGPASYNSREIENVFFRSFVHIRHFRKWGQYYYIVLFSPLSPFHWRWPQNTWPWTTLNGLNGHFTLYVHYYELPLAHYLLLIYCSLFITRDVTSGEVREAEYSKQWSAERQNIWNPRKTCGSSVDAISSEP